MEPAALTNAQHLARQATLRKNDSSYDAAKQQNLIAEEYSRAAKEIKDQEALRILDLLESHHRHIAEILGSTLDKGELKSDELNKSPSSVTDKDSTSHGKASSTNHRKRTTTSASATSSAFIPRPTRDLSASIASNLASARGKPPARAQKPSAVSQKSAPHSDGSPDTAKLGQETAATLPRSDGPLPSNSSMPSNTSDDAFHTFYNRFEGLFNKLSVPLAFAGLPLIPEDDTRQPQIEHSDEATHKGVDSSLPKAAPLEQIFSSAALKAMNAEAKTPSNVQESFLLVPPRAAGSLSYAAMASRGTADGARRSLDEGDDDQVFVDAEERASAASEALPAKMRQPASVGVSGKTIEELELENQSLKKLTDVLAHRLHKWESNWDGKTTAMQESSQKLNQNQESGEGPSKKDPNAPHGAEPDATSPNVLKQLEDQLRSAQRQVESVSKENEKLRTVVTRYRERWDNLRTATKAKQDCQDTRGVPKPSS